MLVALSCLAVVSALGLVAASPASAYSYLLCRGYDACVAAGMPHAGYKAHRWTMYWRMYGGHNCTNYAAYRMVRSGMPNDRPWDGAGNATYWGTSKPRITDTTPRVGAVAWWKSNVPYAGSAGHVAYVERVVSADEIIVSEDNWGGDFQWRRVTRSGPGWPSGFIHFNDVRLRSTRLPRISGAPRVGEVLTASTGTWGPVAARAGATYRYQWRVNGGNVSGATDPTFTVRPAHQGRRISVRVRASSFGYLMGSALSASTAPVEATTLENVTPPAVSGDATVGSTLTASSGEWTAAPTTLTYQWLADGAPVDGATTSTLAAGPDLAGKTLSVQVTATRDGYTDASVVSAATSPVAPGSFTRSSTPAVSGTPRLGETLTVDPGSFTPTDAEVSIRWLRAGVPVEGAAGSTYRLTAADLGSRMVARVRLTKPGYTSLRTRSAPTRRVKTVPVMRVATEPGTGLLGITASLTAEGVQPVTGTVRIRSGRQPLAELTLRRGTAATTLRGLPKGQRTFRIRYLGSRTVAVAAVARTVRIR